MASFMRRIGGREFEIRTRDSAGTWMAKAYHALDGSPVLINGAPLEMPGADEQAALNRAIAALEHVYPTTTASTAMDDYKTYSDRKLDELALAERDTKHLDNLKVLSKHCRVPVEEVMEFIRPGARLKKTKQSDGKVVSSSDFREAPSGLTDPELAEWAVQKIST
jgi:hypothetical protein